MDRADVVRLVDEELTVDVAEEVSRTLEEIAARISMKPSYIGQLLQESVSEAPYDEDGIGRAVIHVCDTNETKQVNVTVLYDHREGTTPTRFLALPADVDEGKLKGADLSGYFTAQASELFALAHQGTHNKESLDFCTSVIEVAQNKWNTRAPA